MPQRHQITARKEQKQRKRSCSDLDTGRNEGRRGNGDLSKALFTNSIFFHLCIAYVRIEHKCKHIRETNLESNTYYIRLISQTEHDCQLDAERTIRITFSTYSILRFAHFPRAIVAIFVLSIGEFIDFDFVRCHHEYVSHKFIHALCALIAIYMYVTSFHFVWLQPFNLGTCCGYFGRVLLSCCREGNRNESNVE